MRQNAFAVGAPLGKLTALLQPPSWMWGSEIGKGNGKGLGWKSIGRGGKGRGFLFAVSLLAIRLPCFNKLELKVRRGRGIEIVESLRHWL